MKALFQRAFAKILIIPAVFSFALACCQPVLAQAAQPVDGRVEARLEQTVKSKSELTLQEGHDCDHPEHHEENVLQTPTKKITINLAFSSIVSSAASFYQYPTVDSYFVALPRITGPPWDGKSIKAFLGVYRS